MQGIYTHILETNYVPREYGVAAILLLLFMVLISLVSVLNLLYFYISTYYYYYYYYYLLQFSFHSVAVFFYFYSFNCHKRSEDLTSHRILSRINVRFISRLKFKS